MQMGIRGADRIIICWKGCHAHGGYGVEGFLAKDAEELKTVLGIALTRTNPTLIEVPVGMMPYPF